jgi:hypothetical protein
MTISKENEIIDGVCPYKPMIKIDDSGASTWENMLDYFLSEGGQEFLKETNKFAKQYIDKK